jgi:mRNA interferase MazF
MAERSKAAEARRQSALVASANRASEDQDFIEAIRSTRDEPGGDLAAESGYAGKPPPVVIVQDDRLDGTDSVTTCAFTTDPTEASLLRLVVEPNPQNGLRETSSLMVDKVTTVRRSKLGERVGRLASEDMVRLERALVVFLGLAG